MDTLGLEQSLRSYIEGRVESGDIAAEDLGRLMARYGLMAPQAFVDEMVERGAVIDGALRAAFCPVQFAEFVASHAHGDPTPEGYKLGMELYAAGDDYDVIGAEVATRGLTTKPEGTTERFLVFVQNASGRGATFVTSIACDTEEEAEQAAMRECAEEWGCAIEELTLLGMLRGDADVATWNG
ncbi:hypothetical protein AB7849_15205 [Rhodanobacter sp. 115]|uniref:hypothetical protein n=1 Tax=Rhodanobacter sp. FW021-MT20 TaxID=1162282 RepID=UPI0034E40ADA